MVRTSSWPQFARGKQSFLVVCFSPLWEGLLGFFSWRRWRRYCFLGMHRSVQLFLVIQNGLGNGVGHFLLTPFRIEVLPSFLLVKNPPRPKRWAYRFREEPRSPLVLRCGLFGLNSSQNSFEWCWLLQYFAPNRPLASRPN